jgi:hypothetical protein
MEVLHALRTGQRLMTENACHPPAEQSYALAA